jgi:hypothetical protein
VNKGVNIPLRGQMLPLGSRGEVMYRPLDTFPDLTSQKWDSEFRQLFVLIKLISFVDRRSRNEEDFGRQLLASVSWQAPDLRRTAMPTR